MMTMKRMKHYMMGLLGMLAMVLGGCSEEIIEGPQGGELGEKVTFTMSVSVPGASRATRAMDGTTTPEIKSLYLVVFGQDNFLREMAEAVEIDDFETKSGEGIETRFRVTLSSSADPVNIHLIANYDLSGGVPFGSEGQVIGTLETSGNQDVYWQRVSNVTVKPTTQDEIDNHTLNPTPAGLKQVPLVRNYAQFQLTNSATSKDEPHFLLTRFALVNMPDRGTVAPRISGNNFADYYDGSGTSATCKSYQNIIAQSYTGNEPFTAVLNEYDPENAAAFKWISANADGTAPTQYVYEYDHTFDNARPLSLLLEGYFTAKGSSADNTSEKTYYKLDIIYKDANYVSHYYHILRNFIYKMNISSVTGKGYDTPEEALAQPASNNVSGSTQVEEFNSINDGEYQLFVEKNSIYIVDANQVTFKYRLVKMNTNTSENSKVKVSWDAIDVNDDSGSTTATHVFKQNPAMTDTDDANGWRTVTITPNSPAGLSRDLTANIYVASESGLMRTVKVTLRQPYRMLVEVSPEDVDQTYNYPITVSTFIPNDLPESIFPLDFHYSTGGNTIYPQANTDMPVQINNDGTYDFVKTIRWVDYQALSEVKKLMLINGSNTEVPMKQFDAFFMTNTAKAGTSTVTVKNDFFKPESDYFTINTKAATITKVSIVGTEYYGAGHPVTLKYTLSDAVNYGNLTITITDGNQTSYYTVQNDDRTAGEHQVTLNSQTFSGDITITISATRNGTTQTININNPKKRHLLLIPEGSFRITDQSVLGRYAVERKDNGGGTYTYKWTDQAVDYEWPDFHIDGIASGSRRIGATTGTGSDIEIDATYGGRVQEFTEESEFVFTTYYNYSAAYHDAHVSDGATEDEYFKGTNADPKKYAVLKVGDICQRWAENNGVIDLVLNFTTTKPASLGGE
ncbi:MAG: hypothetical protein IJV24_04680 [Prevotella sp.]|nr:hypothetical protein [Prevotella sp.]